MVVTLLSYRRWRKAKTSKVDPGIMDGDEGTRRASTPGVEVLQDVEENCNHERFIEKYNPLTF